jgi:hypothetical protein
MKTPAASFVGVALIVATNSLDTSHANNLRPCPKEFVDAWNAWDPADPAKMPPLPEKPCLLISWNLPDFFHVGPLGHRIGDIIQTGNWGHEVLAFHRHGRRALQEENDAVKLIWEAALEATRVIKFPEAVSRLDCVFACFGEKEARAFRDQFRPDHKIYQVELVDPDAPVTIADYSAITEAESGPYVEAAARMAATYWNATRPRFPEALIGGAVRVTASIE